jgi:hypothetical protein
MNLEELRAMTPEQRDAILAKQAESLTPVERLSVPAPSAPVQDHAWTKE